MIAVESSDLAGVEYDEWTQTLVIAFQSGGVYQYYSVPPSEYFGLMNADSHGSYFHQNIKNRYQFRRIQ